MNDPVKTLARYPHGLVVGIVSGLVAGIGVADYLVGVEISLSSLYLIPIVLSVWFVGLSFSIVVAVLSVSISAFGDVLAGAVYSNRLIPVLNAAIDLSTYLVVIWLLRSIRSVRAISARIIAAQEEERRRIARDLHDDLGQILTSINLDLERSIRTENSDRKKTLLRRALESNHEARKRLHDLSFRLRPPVLDDIGLKEAVGTCVSEFSLRTGIYCRLEFKGDNSEIPRNVSSNLYRILQEALTNISKYARAKNVFVELESSPDLVTLRVKDDGAGFDAAAIRTEKSLGLAGMRERAQMLAGSFVMQSAPNCGTEIVVSLPVSGE